MSVARVRRSGTLADRRFFKGPFSRTVICLIPRNWRIMTRADRIEVSREN